MNLCFKSFWVYNHLRRSWSEKAAESRKLSKRKQDSESDVESEGLFLSMMIQREFLAVQ